jgi:hypothetical protein
MDPSSCHGGHEPQKGLVRLSPAGIQMTESIRPNPRAISPGAPESENRGKVWDRTNEEQGMDLDRVFSCFHCQDPSSPRRLSTPYRFLYSSTNHVLASYL